MNFRIKEVLNQLCYKDDCIKKSTDNLYDYYLVLTIDNIDYNVIGIKYFESYDEKLIKEQHNKYWNKNDIPVSILIINGEIRVYNNYNYNIDKSLLYSSESPKNDFKLDDFSFDSIHDGHFFNKFSKKSNKNDRVDVKLLMNLEETINKMVSLDKNVTKTEAFDFLTKCILVKYLEDRKILTNTTFSLFNAESFIELLKNDSLNEFFKHLKKKFKGDIFAIEEGAILSNSNCLGIVAHFFEGEDIKTGQLSLLHYDFSIIPIELISSIYERFFYVSNSSEITKVKKESGSFYTPYYLVNFIINRELSLNNENYNNVKILDPSCGSGVFLVAVLKKIVEYYKSKKLTINGKILKDIVEKQIFGIDNNLQALKIAEFSLTIATLDCLDPKDIEVNNYEFPKLEGVTLFCNSFFDESIPKEYEFDYIIGNPPWYGHIGDHVEYCRENEYEISDNQIAQAFVYRALDFIKRDGQVVLILPNGIFYNENADKFRKNLLNISYIYEILNLGSIKNELFRGASYPCSIMKFGKTELGSSIRITNFSPNIFSKIFNQIVFDFSNTFLINKQMFLKDDRIWRVALNGTYYDYMLLNKITLSKTIKDICNENGLKISQGFAGGNGEKEYDEYIGYDFLNDEILNYHIEKNKLQKRNSPIKCERIHNKEQYNKHNKLILRRTLTKKSKTNICSFFNGALIYNNKFFCIYDPHDNMQNTDLLYFLEAILNSKLYFYYQFYISTSIKNSPPEIRKNNVESFPMINYDKNIKEINTIIDCCKKIHNLYECICVDIDLIEQYKNAIEDNIYNLYGINEIDKCIINYTLDYVIDSSKGKPSPIANENDVKQYCLKIKEYFDKLFENEKYTFKYIFKKYHNSYIAVFSINEENNDLLEIDSIIQNNIFNYEDLFVIKNIYGFSEKYFYTVKTSEKINWNSFKAYADYQKFLSDALK